MNTPAYLMINQANIEIDTKFKTAINKMVCRHLYGENGDLVLTYAAFGLDCSAILERNARPAPALNDLAWKALSGEGFHSSWIYGHQQSWVIVEIDTQWWIGTTVQICVVDDEFVYHASIANGENGYMFAINR